MSKTTTIIPIYQPHFGYGINFRPFIIYDFYDADYTGNFKLVKSSLNINNRQPNNLKGSL